MRSRGLDFEPLGPPLGFGLSASAPPSRQGLHHLSSGALDMIPNSAIASACVLSTKFEQNGHREEGRRRRRDRGPVAPAGGGDGDAGQGEGVRRVREGRGGDGGDLLLRASALPVAARHQREHQRSAVRVLPEGDRLHHGLGPGGRAGVRCHQPQTPQAPGVQDALRGPLLRGVALALRIQVNNTVRKRLSICTRGCLDAINQTALICGGSLVFSILVRFD